MLNNIFIKPYKDSVFLFFHIDHFAKECIQCTYAFATSYYCGHFNDFCHATMQSEKDVTREEKSS